MIVDAAMELFLAKGYDGTTMEDIAQRADIGTSTLYRYFPTKESVIVGVLGDAGLIADALRDRPSSEPPEVALGHALIAFLEYASEDPDNGERFRQLVEANARPRARLMEWFGEMHAELVVALEERLEGPAAELHAGAMAWTAIFVLQRSTETARTNPEGPDLVSVARQVMHDLAQEPVQTPRLEIYR